MKTPNGSIFHRVSARTWATTSGLTSAILLSGCAVPFPIYSVSSDHVAMIRDSQKQVELGEFVGSQKTVYCRLQPIEPDGGLTFAQYIRNSFKDEVVISGQKKGIGVSRVAVQVTNVDVDDRSPFTVHTTRNFEGNFMGLIVKERAMGAFVPAVQLFIGDIMASREYKSQFPGR